MKNPWMVSICVGMHSKGWADRSYFPAQRKLPGVPAMATAPTPTPGTKDQLELVSEVLIGILPWLRIWEMKAVIAHTLSEINYCSFGRLKSKSDLYI